MLLAHYRLNRQIGVIQHVIDGRSELADQQKQIFEDLMRRL